MAHFSCLTLSLPNHNLAPPPTLRPLLSINHVRERLKREEKKHKRGVGKLRVTVTVLQADIAKYAKLTVMFSADLHLSQHLWQQEGWLKMIEGNVTWVR